MTCRLPPLPVSRSGEDAGVVDGARFKVVGVPDKDTLSDEVLLADEEVGVVEVVGGTQLVDVLVVGGAHVVVGEEVG